MPRPRTGSRREPLLLPAGLVEVDDAPVPDLDAVDPDLVDADLEDAVDPDPEPLVVLVPEGEPVETVPLVPAEGTTPFETEGFGATTKVVLEPAGTLATRGIDVTARVC